MAIHKFISKNTERFVLFVSGVIVSAVVSGLLEKTITWSEALLIGATVTLIVASVFLFAEASTRVQSLADAMQTSVCYLEEPYREPEVPYRGLIYEQLARLVAEAKTEILALGTAYREKGKVHETSLHSSRSMYLATLEKTVQRHASGKFKYVRILQVSPETRETSISELVGEATAKHCRWVLQTAQQNVSPDLTLAVMQIETQRMTSFMVIDRRHIVVEINGIDSAGNLYAAGFFFIEDRDGRLVEHFVRYFSNLERRASELTLADFANPQKEV